VPLPSPVKQCATACGLPVLQPVSLSNPEFLARLRELGPELIAVVAFSILPGAVIALPPRGCVNLHASLLPRYRGAAPIQWAVINGEIKTGLTTFFIEERVDTGDIILQHEVPILPDETSGELAGRMQEIGAGLLRETVDLIEQGRPAITSQRTIVGCAAPKLSTEDGRIHWEKTAPAICNLVHGLNPKPGAFTLLNGKALKIHRATVTTVGNHGAVPGTIIKANGQLVVACGEGALELREVQLEGKRRLSSEEFLRGITLTTGAHCGA
jgi:methionyl-tRNA formyltransferase